MKNVIYLLALCGLALMIAGVSKNDKKIVAIQYIYTCDKCGNGNGEGYESYVVGGYLEEICKECGDYKQKEGYLGGK